MLFNSCEFLIFLLIVYALYSILTHRLQNWTLLIASYVFYGRWDWRFLSLILISTIVDYFAGQWLHNSQSQRRKKLILSISILTNLGILFTFKYFNFFSHSLSRLFATFDVTLDWRLTSIVLPVGISFYTFQTMSYTIDIYRGKLTPTRSFRDFALFVSFFPQLVAGPIERAAQLLPQVQSKRHITYDCIRIGCWLILLGYFKKVVIADNLACFTEPAFADPSNPLTLNTLIAVYAFAFQIYGDFSGYSDIARGVSKIMGFDLMLNFKMPYFATNPSEFWRRWHISLSTWLRDYLYIPLGGNRGSNATMYRNLMTTMVLGGLWHGASWHFVLWGGFHGTLLISHRLLQPVLERFQLSLSSPQIHKFYQAACIAIFFHITCFGWLLFAIQQISDLPILLENLFIPLTLRDVIAMMTIALFVGPLLLLQIGKEWTEDMYIIKRWPRPIRLAIYCMVFAFIILFGAADQNEFIYFQF